MRHTIVTVVCTLSVAASLLTVPARAGQAQSPDAQAAAQEIMAFFDQFVTAQNAHDPTAVGDLLWDNPGFLWITGGNLIRGKDAALQRFGTLYTGTWHLDPKLDQLQITKVSADVAGIYDRIDFTIGAAGQTATTTQFLWNAVVVKTQKGWQVASILPIAAPKA
jgi:ketosteroid isomerase-like protein